MRFVMYGLVAVAIVGASLFVTDSASANHGQGYYGRSYFGGSPYARSYYGNRGVYGGRSSYYRSPYQSPRVLGYPSYRSRFYSPYSRNYYRAPSYGYGRYYGYRY